MMKFSKAIKELKTSTLYEMQQQLVDELVKRHKTIGAKEKLLCMYKIMIYMLEKEAYYARGNFKV